MSELPESSEERFSAALHGTSRMWRLAIDKRLKHLGIGQAGWMTIAMVAKSAEPMSQRALADLVGVEGPSMVSMLDRLERDGLVTRTPSATDRRCVVVDLTPMGREALQSTEAAIADGRARIAGSLTEAEREQAAQLLRRLAVVVEEQLP
jgi:MarR family transcriptional regulator, transcriptional regulator for hemolysin